MGEAMKQGSALALALVAATALGCGGSSGGEGSISTVSDPLVEAARGPTREFIVPGGDNAVPLYGREASAAEREQASEVIQAWMRARAAKDSRRQCRLFAAGYSKRLTADAHGVTDGRVKTCPQALDYFGPEAQGDYANTLTGPIDSLRVGEGHGYAQYHGSGGIDWDVPVERDEGLWKVATAKPLNQEG